MPVPIKIHRYNAGQKLSGGARPLANSSKHRGETRWFCRDRRITARPPFIVAVEGAYPTASSRLVAGGEQSAWPSLVGHRHQQGACEIRRLQVLRRSGNRVACKGAALRCFIEPFIASLAIANDLMPDADLSARACGISERERPRSCRGGQQQGSSRWSPAQRAAEIKYANEGRIDPAAEARRARPRSHICGA